MLVVMLRALPPYGACEVDVLTHWFEALQVWPDAPVVSKPADSQAIVNSVAQLLH